MGTWGTGISSNDTFDNIKLTFLELYNEGGSVNEITHKLISTNADIVSCEEESNNFWFAIALCQWECKSLTNDVLDRVSYIIESGQDIELWKKLDSSHSDIKKRNVALAKFLKKLRTEKKTPRRRKTKVLRNSPYQKGNCLSFQFTNGNWGGAYVLGSETQTEFGLNYIAITDINSVSVPKEKDFKKAKVIKFRINSFEFRGTETIPVVEEYDEIGYYYEQHHKQIDFQIILVCSIIPNNKFKKSEVELGGNWSWWPETIERQENDINNFGHTKNIALKRFFKRSWWNI